MALNNLVNQGVRVVDVDGDGDDDMLYVQSLGGYVGHKVLFKHINGGQPDLLQAVYDGRLITPDATVPSVRITYAPLTDTNVYAPGECKFIELMSCVRAGPLQVVKRVERDAGLNGLGDVHNARVVSEYFYTGGRFDKKTDGFAGFAETLMTSYALQSGAQSGRATIRSFYTNTVAGKAPRLDEQWTYAVNAHGQYAQYSQYVLERKSFVWQTRQLGATYFDFTSATLSRSYELTQDNSCSMHSECLDEITRSGFDAIGYSPYRQVSEANLAVDNFGNVTQAQTQYGSGVELTDVTTTYDIDTTNWLLRRPKKAVTVDKTHNGQAHLTGTRTVEYTYHSDAARRHLVKQHKSYGAATTAGNVLSIDHEYYSDGQPARTTATDVNSGKQRETTYAYDPFGLPHAVKNVLGTSYTGYDPVLGKLKVEVDSNGLRTDHTYDSLGRLKTQTVQEGAVKRSVTTYTYDTIKGAGARTRLGALLRSEFTDYVAGGATHTTDFWFDPLGRLSMTDYTLPSDVIPTSVETLRVTRSYDALSRLEVLTYPLLSGQDKPTSVRYAYAPAATSNGRLLRVKAMESLQGAPVKETVLWTAEATDQQDRLAQFMSGSVHTQHSIDWRGLITSTQVQNDGWDDQGSDTVLALLQFSYDGEGNLSSRADALQAVTETFGYDALNRLKVSSTQSADPSLNPDDSFTYDTLGNLTGSTRRGTYTFEANKPTQVVAVTSGALGAGKRSYGYDYLGNQVSRPEGKVVYNDFNLPAKFTDASGATTRATFLYDAAGMRARKVTASATVTYAPGLYERHRTASGGTVEHRLRVAGTGATLRYQHNGTSLSKLPTLYTQDDHLGSTSLVTQNELESSGGLLTKVVEKRGYDSFGLRRNPDWKSVDVFGGLQRAVLEQGYTGHDEDFELSTVNMQGRIYDPRLGRFLSADPHVDGANPTQRWNRYAYVSNNPLRFTDPTGFRYNLEAIKQRVETYTSSFGWVSGDTFNMGMTNPQMPDDWVAKSATTICDTCPVNPGDPNAVSKAWGYHAMAAGIDFANALCGGTKGCTDSKFNAIALGYARAYYSGKEDAYAKKVKYEHLYGKPYNPAKEPKPGTDTHGSVGGNGTSRGMCSDGALCLAESDAGKDSKQVADFAPNYGSPVNNGAEGSSGVNPYGEPTSEPAHTAPPNAPIAAGVILPPPPEPPFSHPRIPGPPGVPVEFRPPGGGPGGPGGPGSGPGGPGGSGGGLWRLVEDYSEFLHEAEDWSLTCPSCVRRGSVAQVPGAAEGIRSRTLRRFPSRMQVCQCHLLR